MLQVAVKNGTNAGNRVVKPRPRDWVCPECQRHLRYYWVACPVDSTPRPK